MAAAGVGMDGVPQEMRLEKVFGSCRCAALLLKVQPAVEHAWTMTNVRVSNLDVDAVHKMQALTPAA